MQVYLERENNGGILKLKLLLENGQHNALVQLKGTVQEK